MQVSVRETVFADIFWLCKPVVAAAPVRAAAARRNTRKNKSVAFIFALCKNLPVHILNCVAVFRNNWKKLVKLVHFLILSAVAV